MSLFLVGLLLNCLLGLVTSTNVTCSEPSFCQQQWGPDSHCKIKGSSGNCSCNSNYYLQKEDSPFCTQCPGVGESCRESHCCGKGLICRDGICFCVYINEYCWTVNDSERARFQLVAQCILAVALILTTSILFFLFWKACTRRNMVNRHTSRGSFPSLNSIQHLVLMQLQDRPPPYSIEYLNSWKNPDEFIDEPPSYFEALGHDNGVFTLAEYPGMEIGGMNETTRNEGSTSTNTLRQNQHNISRNNPVSINTLPETRSAGSPPVDTSSLEYSYISETHETSTSNSPLRSETSTNSSPLRSETSTSNSPPHSELSNNSSPLHSETSTSLAHPVDYSASTQNDLTLHI